MPGLTRAEVAQRAGVDPAYVGDLTQRGILTPAADGTFVTADVWRVGLIGAMLDAGMTLDVLGEGFRRGVLSLEFVDSPEYSRLGILGSETFAAVSRRTGLPVETLTRIREAVGWGTAMPGDLVREHELPVIDFVAVQVEAGFRPVAIERILRAYGDALRRLAEAEAEWWRSEIIEPGVARGGTMDSIGALDVSARLNAGAEEAIAAIHHGHSAQTWTANIVGGFELALTEAGLVAVSDRQPAICFLDITGYTRLTQEQGDRAAADLAESLARLVKRSSIGHGGRPVKWLGDGVMFHFRDPGPGVLAALEMIDGIREAGLPPAHVGLHSGPVVMQEGDYYGQTVNLAARIADYARPGEVLVSEPVRDASTDAGLQFLDIGAVELKGVSGTVHLFRATTA